MMKSSYKLILLPPLFTCFLLLPFFFTIAHGVYYIPGPDQAWQLQGAWELFLNGHYVSSLGPIPKDFSNPEFYYLNSWPIGYSFFIYAFMKLGFSISSAAKIFQISSMLLGIVFWNVLARRCFTSLYHQLVFSCLLALFFLSWGAYSSTCLTWALTPLVTLFLLSESVMAVGATIAVLIFFRYQNVALVPATGFWLIYRYQKNWKKFFTSSLCIAVPPLLAYESIAFMNRAHSGVSSFVASYKIILHWKWEWVQMALSSQFLGATLRFDDVITKVQNYFGSTAAQIISYFCSLFFLALSIYIMRSAWRRSDRGLFWWFCGVVAAQYALFWGLAIFLDYPLLDVPRYFYFYIPMFLLFLVQHYLFGKELKFNPIIFSALALTVFLTISGYSRYRMNMATDFQSKAEFAEKNISDLESKYSGDKSYIIADHLYPTFSLTKYRASYFDSTPLFNANAYFTKKTLLFLICDTSSKKNQFHSLARIDEIVPRYGFQHISGPGIELYWKEFHEGSLFAQALGVGTGLSK